MYSYSRDILSCIRFNTGYYKYNASNHIKIMAPSITARNGMHLSNMDLEQMPQLETAYIGQI